MHPIITSALHITSVLHTRRHGRGLRNWTLPLLLLMSGTGLSQVDDNTFVVEAYDCKCGADTMAPGRNSIQLGVRLSKGAVIHTALSTLIGCGEIYLNVDGERYPMRLMSVNEQDGLARLEPVNIADNALRVEQLWRTAPRFAPAALEDIARGEPEIMVLHGPKLLRQPRTLSGIHPTEVSTGTRKRYQFDLQAVDRSSVDHIVGGPVWFKGSEDGLLGIIAVSAPGKDLYKVTCVGTANVLDDRRYRLWKGSRQEPVLSASECKSRQVYWDRIEGYMFRNAPTPDFERIPVDAERSKAMREALLRIKAHMLDSLDTKGPQSLCVTNTDLEYAAGNSTNYGGDNELAEFRVLSLFVKHYNDVYCKGRRAGEKKFDLQVTTLNINLEQISGAEMDLLIECGLPLSELEAFAQEQYALSQMAGFAKRCMVKLANEQYMADPCNVKLMLAEIQRWIKVGAHHATVREHASYQDILKLEPLVADVRAASIEKYTVQLASRKPTLAEVLEVVSSDSCLTTEEGLDILSRFQASADEEARKDLQHGADLLNDLRASIERTYGKDQLEHVEMNLFPVERGVGLSLSILGGGASSARNAAQHSGLQADTTTLYRRGFPLGALGDDLANNVARELWARICKDEGSDGVHYEPTDLRIMGMADGNPVRGRIAMPEECRRELDEGRVKRTPNEELAYARAWVLRRAMQRTDQCGLMQQVGPRLVPVTFAEKGPQYRGVGLRLVMQRR